MNTKIKLIFFHCCTSHCFCFLSATTIQVIYSSLHRFRGGKNGFFTNCFYAHQDAVINMTQWYQAARLIYFQDLSSLHGPPTSKSILLKGDVSRTIVGAEWQIFRGHRSSCLQSWAREPHYVLPLQPIDIYSSFRGTFHLWAQTLGVVLDFSLLLFPHI